METSHESAHRSEEHTSELQSPCNLVCRLLLEKKKYRPNEPDSRSEPAQRGQLQERGHSVSRRSSDRSSSFRSSFRSCFFFFNDTATTEIYTLSLHDALPIYSKSGSDGCESKTARGELGRGNA